MPKTVPTGPGLEPGPFPFSKVVEANGFVFLAGQVGDAPGGARRRPRRHRGRDSRDARQRRAGCCEPSGSTTATSSRPRSTCATSATSRR